MANTNQSQFILQAEQLGTGYLLEPLVSQARTIVLQFFIRQCSQRFMIISLFSIVQLLKVLKLLSSDLKLLDLTNVQMGY
jgi:hypothetical protein